VSQTAVAITGIGMVTPVGATARECALGWLGGQSARRAPCPDLDNTPLALAEMAVLPELDSAGRLGGRRMLKYMSDTAVLGCLAAREAATDAKLTERFSGERVGLFSATGLAAANAVDYRQTTSLSIDDKGLFSTRLFGEKGLAATNPLVSFRVLANMPGCLVSLMEGIRGPSYIFSPWEGQTGAALIEAWRAVASGEVDAALAGGADAAAHSGRFVYLRQAGLIGSDEFPASGAAYVVMERAETAPREGHAPYADITDMSLGSGNGRVDDPLARRLGRMYAAAPAVLLALAAFTAGRGRDSSLPGAITGVDDMVFRFELGRAP